MVDAFDQFHIHGFQYSMNKKDYDEFGYQEIYGRGDLSGKGN